MKSFDCVFLFLVLQEFINLVSSESNEVCNKEDRRTIAPEHVLKALQVLKSYPLQSSEKEFFSIKT